MWYRALVALVLAGEEAAVTLHYLFGPKFEIVVA